MARQVIEGYLQHRYSEEFGIANFQGHLYLDKVVQLPFFISPNLERMDALCRVVLDRVSGDVREQLRGILPLVGEALGGNPRAVIRFVNNILIDLAISSDLAATTDSEAIPVEFFAISRFLQQRWPEMFSILLAADDLAAEVAAWDLENVRANTSPGDPRAKVASSLLSDPGLLSLMMGPQGQAWLSQSSLRRASVNFLRAQQRIASRKVDPGPWNDAFMSYSHEDKGVVSRIAERLANEGLRLFMETEAPPEDAVEIEFVLNFSSAFCFFIGSGQISIERARVLKMALRLALESKELRIIPILLPRAVTSCLPDDLLAREWVDLRGGITPQTLKPLIATLKEK